MFNVDLSTPSTRYSCWTKPTIGAFKPFPPTRSKFTKTDKIWEVQHVSAIQNAQFFIQYNISIKYLNNPKYPKISSKYIQKSSIIRPVISPKISKKNLWPSASHVPRFIPSRHEDRWGITTQRVSFAAGSVGSVGSVGVAQELRPLQALTLGGVQNSWHFFWWFFWWFPYAHPGDS